MKKSIFLSFVTILNLHALSDQELIGLKEAYKLTITGNGINVGVIDSAISGEHPSLKDKVLGQTFSTINGKAYTPDYSVDTHGSHVAGIIGAKYIDENNPHGVAYNAKLYGVQILGIIRVAVRNLICPMFIIISKIKMLKSSIIAGIQPFILW